MPDSEVRLHATRPEDATAIATLIKQSKAAAMPWLAVVHPLTEDIDWVQSILLPQHAVIVARTSRDRTGEIIGVLATSPGWLDQLYVHPLHQDKGVGRALIEYAKAQSSGQLQLWMFSRNTRARTFYERHGFEVEEETDGPGNEEKEPDTRLRLKRSD